MVLATRRQDLKEAVDLREGKLLLRRGKTQSGVTTEEKDMSESRSVKIALLGTPPGAPAEVVRGGNFDVVLICTKSGQTADAGRERGSRDKEAAPEAACCGHCSRWLGMK